MALLSIGANLWSAWLSDRINQKYLLYTMMAAQLLSLLGLLYFGRSDSRILFIIGQGIANGIYITLLLTALPRLFGVKNLGAISSICMSILFFSSAVGPFLFSLLQSFFGTFDSVFFVVVFYR